MDKIDLFKQDSTNSTNSTDGMRQAPDVPLSPVKKAEEIGADMVVGTDPDSDRLGIAVRNLDGKMEIVNGNGLY